ncbi:2-hydroxyacid dehydrogenase, partial [Pseudomonas laurentiana]|nr:2-hydroxyacid dehydrogenase [Pseudomonas laurentiana]
MTKTVLVLVETVDDYLPLLRNNGFNLILAQTPALRREAIARHGSEIDAVLTRGPLGLYADEMAALPQLKIICVIGAGYEQVDLAAAAARGITVTNGAGANASTVADHAMALLCAVVRDIPRADASTRRGEWNRVISVAGRQAPGNSRVGCDWPGQSPSVALSGSTCRSVTTAASHVATCPTAIATACWRWHRHRTSSLSPRR